MSILEAIKNRRTIRDTKKDPVSEEILMELLEAASYAPFHSKEEPWQFIMVSEEKEKEFYASKIVDSYQRMELTDTYTVEKIKKSVEFFSTYIIETPMHLIITTEHTENEKKNLEAIGATCSFVQNLQLAAWEKNIGMVWRTNPYIFDNQFYNEMGIPENRKILGALHIGYINTLPKATKKRKHPSEWTIKLSQNITL
ncbi:nitroreductase [Bacillus sp. EAC]|uniref:nitroreductase family protein n=1 Tax=Bacillus sp. EAC TaxID=1978338 RepID=UPI000B43A561|nr:nitroreductase [Bacillus sp. EAC]